MENEDYWDSVDKERTFTDEEMEAANRRRFADPDWTDPTTVVLAFIGALREPEPRQSLLRELVHPATASEWGNFEQAAQDLKSYGETGVSEPSASTEDPSVLYSGVLGDFKQSFTVGSDDVVSAKAIITLKWSPNHGRWLVVHMGDYVLPEDIPAP